MPEDFTQGSRHAACKLLVLDFYAFKTTIKESWRHIRKDKRPLKQEIGYIPHRIEVPLYLVAINVGLALLALLPVIHFFTMTLALELKLFSVANLFSLRKYLLHNPLPLLAPALSVLAFSMIMISKNLLFSPLTFYTGKPLPWYLSVPIRCLFITGIFAGLVFLVGTHAGMYFWPEEIKDVKNFDKLLAASRWEQIWLMAIFKVRLTNLVWAMARIVKGIYKYQKDYDKRGRELFGPKDPPNL